MISLMMTLDSSKEQICNITKVKINLIFPSTYFSVLRAATKYQQLKYIISIGLD